MQRILEFNFFWCNRPIFLGLLIGIQYVGKLVLAAVVSMASIACFALYMRLGNNHSNALGQQLADDDVGIKNWLAVEVPGTVQSASGVSLQHELGRITLKPASMMNAKRAPSQRPSY